MPSGSDPDAGVLGPPDADTSGFVELVGTSWSLPAGTEQYRCVRLTVSTDMWISAFEPIAPLGTHHTVLMVEDAGDQPDGDVACSSALSKPVLYASGVGTEPLALPPGVAVKVSAGQQLFLNLHLFNASSDEMTGHSGVAGMPVDAATVTDEAGVILAGKMLGLVVVPNASTQTGHCTMSAPSLLYAVMPHMHQLGTHLKLSYDGAGGSKVLLDDDYAFSDQRYRMLAPSQAVAAGDRLTVDCSYFNPTTTTVRFGESTEDEMCFAITYTIPRITGTGGSAFCIQ